MKNKLLVSILGVIGVFSLSGCINATSSSSSSSMTSNTTSSQTTSSTTSNNSSTMQTYEGEFKETTYGQDYVTKVKVSVENGIIKKVEIKEGSNVYTDSKSWPGNTVWTSKEEQYLKSFESKTVESVKSSQANIVDNVAGATLTSNRIYKAVKDALK